MPKPKRVNKSREEILAEMKARPEFKEKLSFIKDKFYPALVEATSSVEEAITHLGVMNSFLVESFLGFMKEKKFSELGLQKKLSPLDPKYEQNIALLDLLNDHSVFDAKAVLEGLKSEIELFKRDMFTKMELKDLLNKWIDEIT